MLTRQVVTGKGYLDLLRSWSIVAFSRQYCSTNLLLTSAASPGLEEGHNTSQTHTHTCGASAPPHHTC